YVSHDLAVVAALADRVAVMYAGRVVEIGPERDLFRTSAHPYARRLVEAIPEMSGEHELIGIPGTAPRPGHRPQGCFFAPRCDFAVEVCHQVFPPRERVTERHETRCHRWREVVAEAAKARPHAADSARHPVRLPEPVQLAQPAQDDRPDRRPAAAPLLRPAATRRALTDRAGARARAAHGLGRRPVPARAERRRAAARGDRAG